MTEQNQTTENGTTPAKSNNLMVIGLVALLLIGGGAYYMYSQDKNGDNMEATDSDHTGPVATVDGVELSRAVFETTVAQASQSYASQGVNTSDSASMDAIRQEVLDTMINRQLILAAAAEEGISISDKELETSYQQVLENVGGEEGLASAMTEAGLDETTLRTNISTDLLLQKYVDSHVSLDTMEVSEEEVTNFYNSAKEANPDLEPLEEVSEAIKAQLAFQKQQAEVAKILNDLRAQADIEITL